MGNDNPYDRRRPSRPRRQFLQTAAITGVSAGLLSQTVSARDDDDAGTDDRNPFDPPPGGGGGDINRTWEFSDEATDNYGGSVEGYASMAVVQFKANPVSDQPWDRISLQINGNAITHTDTGVLLSNVERSGHAISWDDSSAAGPQEGLIHAAPNSDWIGGYHDEYDDGEGNNVSDYVIDFGLSQMGADKYVAAAETIFEALGWLYDDYFDRPETYERDWDWDGRKQTSWWTKYEVNLEPNETLEINVGDVVDLIGKPGALHMGGTFELIMPANAGSFRERIEARVSSDRLLHAGIRGIEFPEIHEGLTAYAGATVNAHPERFDLDTEAIAQLDDHDFHYQYPVEMSLTGPLPDDFWDDKHVG
ncbi:twin-arginine translocation signal domain-containing protein [Halovivax gelatinilyticus]|uniref:twin-arginine translocation signal domain-containing protein n=1 Tax=Halovivax gelatinilyticus TaxID=2961597 RepID=UPI0020CA774D|nr:twin-arginine translocation signal domain-containing protein [Halovivax gelatinilyticus]